MLGHVSHPTKNAPGGVPPNDGWQFGFVFGAASVPPAVPDVRTDPYNTYPLTRTNGIGYEATFGWESYSGTAGAGSNPDYRLAVHTYHGRPAGISTPYNFIVDLPGAPGAWYRLALAGGRSDTASRCYGAEWYGSLTDANSRSNRVHLTPDSDIPSENALDVTGDIMTKTEWTARSPDGGTPLEIQWPTSQAVMRVYAPNSTAGYTSVMYMRITELVP